MSAPATTGRVPTEFRYWEQESTPYARALRAGLRAVFGSDPKLPDDVIRTWAESYYDADPVAEAFVDEVYLKRGQAAGRAMVDQALAEGVESIEDAPATLLRLFSEIEQLPPWLDRDLVELGARVFRRFGTKVFSFAGAITLHGYRENSVAKPLALTGAYTGESANRRFLETASFWIDVAQPGALFDGGRGVHTALRVRLMHVFVRRRLLSHPEWDVDAWGVPISQADAMLTLMGGSVAPGYGLRLLGYRVPREEIVALLHFWRYIGHLLGVQPKWYPETPEEGIGILYANDVKSVRRAGEDGKNLAHSYLASYAPTDDDAGREWASKWLEHGLERGYTAWFLPPQSAWALRLPSPGVWALTPALQFAPRYAFESLRRRSAAVDRWADRRARNQARAWVDRRLGKRSVEYRAVSEFQR